MSKPFFEVFPTLKAGEDIRNMFEGAQVLKVTTNSDRTFLRVHIVSRHLIQKTLVYEMEHLIKNQLFGRSAVQLIDTVIAQGKKDSLTDYLKGVYAERFGLPIEIRVMYKEPKESTLKYNDMRLQQEVDSILDQVEAVQKQKEEKKQEKEAKSGEKETSGSGQGGKNSGDGKNSGSPAKGGFSKGSGFQKGGFRDKKVFVKSAKMDLDESGLIYGRPFDDEPIELSTVIGEMGEITFRGKVISFDTREIRNEKTIVMYAVTDFTDTIMVKMFVRNDQLADVLAEIKMGAFLKIKGVTNIDKFDGELVISSVFGIKKISDFTESRKDNAVEKRVELHCHTKMSDMDGVSEVKDLVKRAHDWGHKAIAITDHGVVQAFPDANHYIETLDKDDPFKVIYGVEGYLVEDLAVNEKGQSLKGTYVVFDLETTGFSSAKDKIIEIGAVKVENGEITDKYSTFVNPKIPIPFRITQLTSITDEMVMESPEIETILPQFLKFVGDAVLVAHNASFDVSFI